VTLDIVDHAKPIPQGVDELAVDELASAGVHAGRSFAGLDQQAQARTPGVAAEVVEAGAVAGACDETVQARS